MLEHIRQVDLEELEKRLKGIPAPTARKQKDLQEATRNRSRSVVYRNFLLFDDFYCAERPTLFFEGKSDPAHLRGAIRSRAQRFPGLAVVENGRAKLKVRLYRYSNSPLAQLFGVDGGFGAQTKLLNDYFESIIHFKPPISRNPIVLVVDHDSGGRQVYAAAAKFNSAIQPLAGNFWHVAHNVYLTCVPPVVQPESEIERPSPAWNT